jgi:CheY-like chemotaxis protein
MAPLSQGKIPELSHQSWFTTTTGYGIADCLSMRRVLLLEDCPDVLYLLQIELEWLGYEVDAMADGNTALAAARRIPPDIIVSDLRMPDMDGFEFIQRVRLTSGLRSVPAIALTGSSMDQDVQRALAVGFTAHLTKPIEPVELVKRIEQLTAPYLVRKAG